MTWSGDGADLPGLPSPQRAARRRQPNLKTSKLTLPKTKSKELQVPKFKVPSHSRKMASTGAAPPAAPDAPPARENRLLKRVFSVPSVDELSQVLKQADGKDRVVGLLQYIALFASGGRPGPLTSIGLGLNDARRPFRLYKPIESLLPILKGRAPTTQSAPPPKKQSLLAQRSTRYPRLRVNPPTQVLTSHDERAHHRRCSVRACDVPIPAHKLSWRGLRLPSNSRGFGCS